MVYAQCFGLVVALVPLAVFVAGMVYQHPWVAHSKESGEDWAASGSIHRHHYLHCLSGPPSVVAT